ncbi:formate dehydrogenase subunit delta [Fulvimarina sp. 2208YS6-2-32]|uniref:Formate dehydrogenase subunit delta n=1 Tax=Fulvimarina uroteuthidis TaxID=3098149 RepID=A0ABU5HWQ4_9HYPH|nr:formate dehydrogenase subunit delta [Fulvimarina sp. 2208YS6-2-32]MDY8107569.1 formate dehydrogenase subunit delta [Fulvimarina sp. 2208YS6-2-32]
MERDKLVHMANQIATFFQSTPEGARSEGVADHINRFWEPRMRTQLFAKIDANDTGELHPLVLEAVPHIRRPDKPLEQRADRQAETS